MRHLISNLKTIFSCFIPRVGSTAKVILAAVILSSFSVSAFATTTVGESSEFTAGPNATWTNVITLTTVADGASSQGAQTLSINVTGLPDSGANYRVFKTTANGSSFFGNATALALGESTITVAGVAFDRAVKIQFSSPDISFDALSVNGNVLYPEESSDEPAAGITIGDSSDFYDKTHATWVKVIDLALLSDGASSQAAQTLSMNVTELPDGGANYRVYKTTANGSDFFGNTVALVEGANNITVGGVAFDRAVKLQFSSADVRFDALSVNGDQLYPEPPAPTTVNVTFSVDMSAVETNADGVYLAGGGVFGQDGVLMTDNGSDVWSATVELDMNTQVLYKFRNQPSYGTWDGFEDAAGIIDGGCNIGQYNDRFVDVAEADIVLDTVAYGSCTAAPYVAPVVTVPAAPAATDAADSVLSVFSTTYGNLDGTDFNPNWGQSTSVEVGDNLLYTNLNYQGTAFANQDVSGYEYLNVGYYVVESTAVNFFVISPGAEKPYALDVSAAGQWNNVQIPLSHYDNVNLADVFQFKVDGNGSVAFNNIYFGGTAVVDVPGCTDAAADNYNESATTDDGTCTYPPATVSVTFSVDMSAVETNADGVYLAGGPFGQDGHALTDNGSDVWSVTLDLDPNTQYMYKFRNQPSYGTWDGFEDPAGLIDGGCSIGQYNDRFVDVAEADIVLDTVAYGSCTAEPYVAPVVTVPAAPAATDAADSVLSVFSTTYGNLDGTDFNPNWGQSTSVEVGDNLLYTNLNYQGTAFANQNVSGYEYLNVGYYVVESTAVNFFVISPGAEKPYALDVSAAGQWNNVQIPLSHYDNVNLADVFQFKVDGNGSVAFNNIYFGGVVADVPGCNDAAASNFNAAATSDDGSCVYAVGTLAVGDAIDFETNIALESFGGTNASIDNGVLTVVKDAGAATWAGNVIARGDVVFPLTATDTLITAEVHSTVPATIRMKLELASDGGQSAEVDSTVAHTGSGWETLTFDFADTNAIDANFDVLVLFPNFGVDGAGNTYQYDNITFVGGVAPEPEVPTTVNVTFSVDMSAVETNADGVYLAGGGVFGQDGVLMTDNGSDVWSATVELDMNTQVLYKFRNQPSYGTWDGFEDPAGLIEGGCNIGQYNDRFVDVAEADIVLDTVAYGSCTAEPYVAPAGPEVPAAPAATDAADSVLSVFSTTYGNLDGTDFNPNWGQSTSVEVGDNLLYTNLNYQGTAFANQDVSGYEYLNVGYYVVESTAVNFFVISPGAEKPYALDVSAAGQWNNVQIPLSHYDNVNLADVFQFKVDGNGSVAFNNIYFGGTAAAPEPAAGITIGESSDFYDKNHATWVKVINLALLSDGASSQAAQTLSMNVTELPEGGANYRVYKTTANGGDFFGNAVALSLGANNITVGGVGFDRAVKIQLSSADVRFDTLSVNGSQLYPVVDVPGCTDAAADNYNESATTDDGTCTYPPATVSVTFSVDMSAVETNADGVYLAGGPFGQDGHALTDNGSDVWSVTLDLDPNTQYMYKFRNQPSYGTWDGFEDPAGLIDGGCSIGQYNDRFVDVAEADIVLDTVAYGSCTAEPYVAPVVTVPAAPAATDAADSVLSVFSTTYGNLDGTDFNPNWGQSTSVEVGDNLLYTNLNYQGTAFANQNVSGYEYLNVGYYVVESTAVNFFVISPGAEKPYALDVSAAGQWNNVQIPLSHYDNVNLADVFQFKVDGNGSVAFNNIYFGGVVADVPGCNDAAASNFNAAATSDDGSCVYAVGTLAVGDAIDFETNIALESFGGTNASIDNGVLTVVKDAGAATWAGNVIARGDVVFPLTATDTLITAEVHSTVPATIRMKLELASDGGQSAEVDSTVAHTGSGWETLTFDFADTNAIDANFDVLVLFPNFGVDGAGNTYQYDNITFVGGVAPEPEVPTTVNVTFSVDMSAVETNADGVYLAGGGVFGQDGVLMTDNGSDVWSATVELDMNTQVLYKFRNQPSYGTWDGFEDPAGLIEGGCNIGQYNDRFVDVAEADIVLDTVAYGSCTAEPYVAPAGPEVPAAPAATDAADSVLSVFSTTYGNLDGTDFNPNWGQSTSVEVGDNLLYTNLNYQGTAFANQDVSGYEYLNVGYYVVESTAVNFFVISPGAEKPYALDVSAAGQWNNVQIPLSHYDNVNLADVFQFKVDGNGSVAFNNIYFGGTAVVDVPGCTDVGADNYEESATTDDGSCTYPVPGCMDDTADNYDPAATMDDTSCTYPPATVSVTFSVDMSAVETNADGVYLAGGPFGQDGHALTDNGSDVWSVTLDLDPNTQYMYKFRNQPSYGTWDGFEDPAGLIDGGCSIGQYNDRFVDVAEADIVLDTVAYGSCTAEPYVAPVVTVPAAPAATDAADSVLSVFSTTYGNLDGTDFNPNWGQSTSVEVGDNLLYTNLNYQGTAFANQNVSGYEYLNVGYYVVESTAVNFFVISPGAEKPYALDVSAAGQWNNVQIPLSHYDNVNLADVFQFKVDGNGSVAFNNIYFGGTAAAPEPEVPTTVSVTFSVDMSAVETNADGVYLAGGAFGQDGHALTDNGSDVWSVTLDLAPNAQYMYKFRNQPSYGTWDGFEDAAGLVDGGCNTGDYNDRFVDVAEADIVLDTVAYGSCTAEPFVAEPAPGAVTLAVGDAIDFETVVAVESFGGTNGSIVEGVLNVVKDAGAATWAGNVIARGGYIFPLTATDTLMTVDVHSTVAATIRMKLELASDGGQSAEVDSTVAHTGSGWETLTFDFAGTNAIDANFDVLVLFPNFGVDGAGNTYQYDNVTFAGGVAPEPEVPTTVAVTFSVDMSAVETHPEGVYLAGGGVFGQDGILMTDNGSDVWTTTVDLDMNTQVLYKFRNQPSYGTWDGFESPVGLIEGGCNIGQYNDRFVDVAEADIVLDTVAYGSCTAEPYVAPAGPEIPTAPVPADAADTVLSVFSSTYGNLDGTDFNPNWGQSTQVEAGDNLLYTGLNYQGTAFANQDVSGYEYLNVDYYVVESSAVNFFVISPGAETSYALDVSSAEQWNSVQIPLSHYADVVNLADVFQFKVDGNGSVAFNNIYFGGTPVPADSDGDGVADEDDAFPNDASESVDSDGDGVGDNADYAPNNPDVTEQDLTIGAFSGAFGGVVVDGDTYTFPSGAEAWAGVANENAALYPFSFPHGGTLTFTGAAPEGDVNVRFRFERLPWPDVDPAFDTETITVTGGEEEYSIEIPSQGENTFASFLLYVVDRDTPVVIKDVRVTASADPSVAVFSGEFGGMSINGDTFTFPSSAEAWAGLANNNTALYPISLEYGATLTFTGSADSDVAVYFRFEKKPWPDTEPSFNTDSVTVSGEAAEYSIDIPAQAMNTFSSFLMYVVDRDLPVTVSNVKMTAKGANWDFDGNGNIDALTDGLLLVRYAFGLRGEMLSANTIALDSSLSASDVESRLERAESISDIDGDGQVDPLTDGLLLLRHLFGMHGDDLIKGVVHPDGSRQTAEEIADYMDSHMP